jgi:hypothetical protein
VVALAAEQPIAEVQFEHIALRDRLPAWRGMAEDMASNAAA